MTSRTGKIKSKTASRAFTLIELIVVMLLLVAVISMAAPRLAGFFRGRSLDSEARRLLALTREGQSRAVTQGIPMLLWLDVANRSYGLEEEPGYVDQDLKAINFSLDSNVQIEMINTNAASTLLRPAAPTTSAAVNNPHRNLPTIRFLPDGSVDETSPFAVHLFDATGASLWLMQSRSRLNYEIQSTNSNATQR